MVPIHLLEPANDSMNVPILDEPLHEFIRNGFDNAFFDTMEGYCFFSVTFPFTGRGRADLYPSLGDKGGSLRCRELFDGGNGVSYPLASR